MCLWASHNKANAALSGNPFPLPLTLSICLSHSVLFALPLSLPLSWYMLFWPFVCWLWIQFGGFFFIFVLFSAPHITQCLRSPRIVSRLRGLRYVTLHWNAKLLDPSPPLHSTSLPFPSFLTCPLFVNSCRRVWLIVVFVCPFWLLFNCAEAVSEGGGESVDEDEELSPIATPPHPSLHALRALRTRSCWLKGRFTPRSDYLQCALPTVQPMWSVHSDRAVVSLSS